MRARYWFSCLPMSQLDIHASQRAVSYETLESTIEETPKVRIGDAGFNKPEQCEDQEADLPLADSVLLLTPVPPLSGIRFPSILDVICIPPIQMEWIVSCGVVRL